MNDFAPFAEGHADWLISEGSIDGSRIVYATRDCKPTSQEKNDFRILILIRWQFEKASEVGFPSDAGWQKIKAFEDRALESSGKGQRMAICAAISTTSSTREWRFYAQDADAFQREFGEALRGLGPIPPNLQVFDDPDWDGFAEIRESVS